MKLCTGSNVAGKDITDYLLEPYLLGRMEEEKVLCMAAYAISGAKRGVPGVGGLCVIKSLHKDGAIVDFTPNPTLKFVESHAFDADQHFEKMFVSAICDKDENFEANLRYFTNHMRSLRSEWIEARSKGIPVTFRELPKA